MCLISRTKCEKENEILSQTKKNAILKSDVKTVANQTSKIKPQNFRSRTLTFLNEMTMTIQHVVEDHANNGPTE